MRRLSVELTRVPQVLIPYNRAEAATIREAGKTAGRPPRTVREWCMLYDIGRKICGQWLVSKPALLMLLEGDEDALAAYLAGDRSSTAVMGYFVRCGVPLPKQPRAA